MSTETIGCGVVTDGSNQKMTKRDFAKLAATILAVGSVLDFVTVIIDKEAYAAHAMETAIGPMIEKTSCDVSSIGTQKVDFRGYGLLGLFFSVHRTLDVTVGNPVLEVSPDMSRVVRATFPLVGKSITGSDHFSTTYTTTACAKFLSVTRASAPAPQ